MERLVKILKDNNKTISSMESCTGGMFSNEITNIDGSSNVFRLGLVTYSNEFKEYFGVSNKTINEYTVYSNNVSQEMAKKVQEISHSDYSVGITGMLGTVDPNNIYNNNDDDLNSVFITIYVKDNEKYLNYKIKAKGNTRREKKEYVINYIKEKLYGICE